MCTDDPLCKGYVMWDRTERGKLPNNALQCVLATASLSCPLNCVGPSNVGYVDALDPNGVCGSKRDAGDMRFHYDYWGNGCFIKWGKLPLFNLILIFSAL